MLIGMAADHGGFDLKEVIKKRLMDQGHEIRDFGADAFAPEDDFPDYVTPLARAVAAGQVKRGIAICGSGVGACVAANKIHGVRAALITDVFSARQGVEDDNMNILCLGARVLGPELAWDLTQVFLEATFKPEVRFVRRLRKIAELEHFSE